MVEGVQFCASRAQLRRYTSPIDEPFHDLCSLTMPGADASDQSRTIALRLADNGEQRSSARMLINRMYSWRGYGDFHEIPFSDLHSTFTASHGDQLLGTITLGVDSAAGLAADDIFREEIDVFRAVPGAKVCELTKLAFDAEVPSKPLLAALFHVVFIFGRRRHGCTDLFIEVNPRHRRFYEAMLGFRAVGCLKTNASVGAPAQLMWLEVANIRTQIDHHTQRRELSGSRSLYPFFFSPKEEAGIHARLDDRFDERPTARVSTIPQVAPAGLEHEPSWN